MQDRRRPGERRDLEAQAATRGRDTPSRRELDVLRCWAVGQTDDMTAVQLGISVHTVHNHARNVRHLLRAKTRAHAVANAIRAGLI